MLGQTEIERIADEILSELQAGDRTEAVPERRKPDKRPVFMGQEAGQQRIL